MNRYPFLRGIANQIPLLRFAKFSTSRWNGGVSIVAFQRGL